MTLAHFIYIPGVLMVGLVIGWIFGGRAAQGEKVELDEKAKRRAAREARRAAREARD